MSIRWTNVGLLVVCTCIWAGCSARIANFTMLSAQNLDFEHTEYVVDKTRRVTGKDTVFILGIIPFGLPDAETAAMEAGRGVPGYVGLSNVGVKHNWFWLGLGYAQIEAIGYPIINKGEQK